MPKHRGRYFPTVILSAKKLPDKLNPCKSRIMCMILFWIIESLQISYHVHDFILNK